MGSFGLFHISTPTSMKTLSYFYLPIVALIILSACNSSTQADADQSTAETATSFVAQRHIDPPFENIDVAHQTFSFSAEKGAGLTLSNGTQIDIPASVLVDEKGQAVNGTVELQYREFHDVADLLMSGIPMNYDSAGQQHIFQTAGMMEMNAYQDGKPLEIAQGKEIVVKMASYTESDAYNSYFFNEVSNNWEFTGTNTPEPNERRASSLAELASQPLPAKPQQPTMQSGEKVSFNFDVDYSRYPELAPFKKIQWQYAGIEQEGYLNPDTEKWIFGETWTSAEVNAFNAAKGQYYLKLTSRGRQANMIVTPVISEAEYENAMTIYRNLQQDYTQVSQSYQIEKTRLEAQANMLRTLSVQNFGIYNCDRIFRMEQQRVIAARYDFDQSFENNKFVQISTIYLLMPEENAIIPYRIDRDFVYSPALNNQLIAILPGNEIAIFDANDFASNKITSTYTFLLKSTGKKVNTPEELRNLLDV